MKARLVATVLGHAVTARKAQGTGGASGRGAGSVPARLRSRSSLDAHDVRVQPQAVDPRLTEWVPPVLFH